MVPSAKHRAIIVPAASSAGKSSLASTGRSLREILLPMKMPEMICVSSFREEGMLASPVAMLSAATKIIEPTRYPPGTCRFPSSIPPMRPRQGSVRFFRLPFCWYLPYPLIPAGRALRTAGLFSAAFCIQAERLVSL